MKQYIWTHYTFADGNCVVARKLSQQERKTLTKEHGTLVSTYKEKA